MSVHRWRYRRILGWLIPLLAYLCVLTLMASSYRSADKGRALVSDDAYRNLVVANVLNEARVYGVYADQPVPMVQDMLWRVALAATQIIVPDGLSAVRILGMVFGVLTLLQLIRFCRVIFPYPLYGYYTAGLVVLAPGLATAALSGLAVPLTMFLVTTAVVRHVENITGSGPGLPLAATCLIGLALWVRLEFVVVWFVLFVHCLIWSAISGERRPSFLNAILRGLNGLLILALFLLPILAWNMWVLQVPWPRLPGVPMAADLWAIEGAGAAWSATVILMREGWAEGYAQFGAYALPNVALGRLFYGIGFLLLIIQGVRSEEERGCALLLVLTPLLAPFFFGLAYPYMGWSALPTLAQSFQPIFMAIAAYGVIRFPFVVEGLGRKWISKQWTGERVFAGWWAVVGGILILLAVAAQVRDTRAESRLLSARMAEREWLDSVIEQQGLIRDRFISDQLGWLVWRHGVAMLDLRAEWSPDMLRHVDLQGEYDTERLSAFMEQLNPPPGVLVAWDPVFHPLAKIMPSAEIIQEPDEDDPDSALMVMATWPGVL